MNLGRSGAPPPRRCAHRRDVVDHGRQHGHVRDVGGGNRGSQWQPVAVADQVEFAPRLATIDRICAHVVPHAWRARSWCPRWPATSPPGLARPADPGPPSAVGRTRRRWPTRSGSASRSPLSRSRAPGPGAAARERNRQQRLDQCPQLVRHKIISEGCHGRILANRHHRSETTSSLLVEKVQEVRQLSLSASSHRARARFVASATWTASRLDRDRRAAPA
jgi:hypothetical protein